MLRMIIVIFLLFNLLIINGFSQSVFEQKKLQILQMGVDSNGNKFNNFVPRQNSNNSNTLNTPSFSSNNLENIWSTEKSSEILSPSALKTIFFNPQKQWGIICRKEWELEKSIGFPIRIRLGTLQYVNQLEGKH